MKRLAPICAVPLVACATVPTSVAGPTASIGQQAYVDGLKVTPLQVLEAGRGPVDVQCVWAGRLVVRAEVSGGRWRQIRNLDLGKPEQAADGHFAPGSAERAA